MIAPPDAEHLPVLFLIHGGGYGLGAGNMDLSEMIKNNDNGFIVVLIQYRLGAFGFLSSKAMSGLGVPNAGLWDQHAALLWVQDNIAAFGGDPTRVTIAGESAGGGSVMAHILAQGGSWGNSLFQNAILASPYLPIQYNLDGPVPEATFATFAVAAGCLDQSNPADNATIFACLQNADSATLQNANQVANQHAYIGTFAFLPVTDGDYLQDLPSQQLKSGNVNGARALTSVCTSPLFFRDTILEFISVLLVK